MKFNLYLDGDYYHPDDEEVKIQQSHDQFVVLVWCKGSPQHGFNYAWYAKFDTLEEAEEWASNPDNVK